MICEDAASWHEVLVSSWSEPMRIRVEWRGGGGGGVVARIATIVWGGLEVGLGCGWVVVEEHV